MRRRVLLLVVVLLVACAGEHDQLPRGNQPDLNSLGDKGSNETQAPATPSPTPLPNLGRAPEWTNDVWLNTDHPLFLADLKGKVVLLEMWTLG